MGNMGSSEDLGGIVLGGSWADRWSAWFTFHSLLISVSFKGIFSIACDAGLNALRKRLFLLVSRPEPSTLMTYWSCSAASITVPVRCHLVGLFPVWFWIKHLSPIFRGNRGFTCSFKSSDVFEKRVRNAFSLADHASRHIGLMWGLEYFSRRFANESESRIGRPKIICAGDKLQSGSGVFLDCNRALRRLSLSREPLGPTFDLSSLLADLTATSARPFDCGWYAEEMRCLTPQVFRNSLVTPAVNSGPPSLDSSSGTPKVENRERKHPIRPRAPVQALPDGVENISLHPDSRSPATR